MNISFNLIRKKFYSLIGFFFKKKVNHFAHIFCSLNDNGKKMKIIHILSM